MVFLIDVPSFPGRKEIISQFKALVSSFPEVMGSMQGQLSKYKETATDIHVLRAEVKSLSSILAQKVVIIMKLHSCIFLLFTPPRKTPVYEFDGFNDCLPFV